MFLNNLKKGEGLSSPFCYVLGSAGDINMKILLSILILSSMLFTSCGASSIVDEEAASDEAPYQETELAEEPHALYSEEIRQLFHDKLPDLALGSDLVIVGRVKGISPLIVTNDAGDEFVLSDMTVEVEKSIHGDAPSEILMRTLGGSIDGRRYIYSISPRIDVGRRHLLFLKKGADIFYPHLNEHGAYILNDDDTVRRSPVALDVIEEAMREAADEANR